MAVTIRTCSNLCTNEGSRLQLHEVASLRFVTVDNSIVALDAFVLFEPLFGLFQFADCAGRPTSDVITCLNLPSKCRHFIQIHQHGGNQCYGGAKAGSDAVQQIHGKWSVRRCDCGSGEDKEYKRDKEYDEPHERADTITYYAPQLTSLTRGKRRESTEVIELTPQVNTNGDRNAEEDRCRTKHLSECLQSGQINDRASRPAAAKLEQQNRAAPKNLVVD